MNTHHALLAAVAVGALIAPGAHAAEKKHVRHHAAAAANDAALRDEVEDLKAQVAALREAINAQHAATASTQTQVATLQTQTSSATQTASTAQDTASAAATHADAAVSKADAVQTAEAKTDKQVGLTAWAGDTRLGATIYANLSNINQQSNGVKQADNGTGFNLKRAYLSVDHRFSPVWSANLTADVSNVIGETGTNTYVAPVANTSTGAISAIGAVGKGFYIKFAYLQAKLDPALTIRAGSSDTSWIPYVQNIYGHRYVEQVLIDEYKLGNSADWGVQAFGDLASGLISYQVGVVNGGGYRNVAVSKVVDVEARLSAQYHGAFAAVGGYSGKLGKAVEGTVTAGAYSNPTYNTYHRLDAIGGFRNDLFTLAAEYVYAKNANSITSATNTDKNNGWSTFANVNITPTWQVFGRYDWIRYTPNSSGADDKVAPAGASVSNHYFNVGLQWEPIKFIDLSLVYKRDAITNLAGPAGTYGAGSIAEQNGLGSIGGSINGTYDEFGLFTQIRF